MAFQYTSLSGTRLNPDEEQLLESIDEFSYPFNGFANLGDLHKQLKGNGVVLSDQTKMTVKTAIANLLDIDILFFFFI